MQLDALTIELLLSRNHTFICFVWSDNILEKVYFILRKAHLNANH